MQTFKNFRTETQWQRAESSMALSCSWSPTLLTTTQSSSSSAASPSTPKLVPCHFPGKPTTTTIHTLSSCSSSSQKWRAKVSFFPAFLNKRKDTQPLKDELLDAIAPLDRGAEATLEDQQTVDQVAPCIPFCAFSFHLLSGFWLFLVLIVL